MALQQDPFLAGKEPVVLMVLGAGRGPLVNASMRAAQLTGRHLLFLSLAYRTCSLLHRKLKLYALEKNPNAVNTLRNLRDNDPRWKDVTVISTDIRNWHALRLTSLLLPYLFVTLNPQL